GSSAKPVGTGRRSSPGSDRSCHWRSSWDGDRPPQLDRRRRSDSRPVTHLSLPMQLNPPFWRDRPTLVTGATGLVGSWVVKRLHNLRADVVCLVRDWVPQSVLIRSQLLKQVKV